MPDSLCDSSPGSSRTPSEYIPERESATPSLADRLRERIRSKGPLSFPEFMAAALYDPTEGYYARPAGQVGRAGDFYTSVSTGSLFGRLLARHISDWHRGIGSPSRWRIVEVGANDGSLAADILESLSGSSPESEPEYVIIEPLSLLAAAQRAKVPTARVIQTSEELAADPLPTFVLGNEVLDALPFHIIESHDGSWQELGVTLGNEEQFTWQPLGPASEGLVSGLPRLAPGYRTEVRSGTRDFLKSLAVETGRMLWIDYGYPREDYYHVARTTGTLRTFSSHRAAEDPLATPGEIDITAHVDFTAVADDIEALGGRVIRFEPQSRFLTNVARPWLLELEGRTDDAVRKDLAAFQTLTHPGHLGARFHVLEASFGEPDLRSGPKISI